MCSARLLPSSLNLRSERVGTMPGTAQPLSVLTDDERAFQGAVAEFARGEVAPRVAAMERAAKLDPALLPKYFELGLMGIQVPENAGGFRPLPIAEWLDRLADERADAQRLALEGQRAG